MKLEDLKLPSHDELFVIWDSAPSVDIALAGISYQVAKSVCDQMRTCYEDNLNGTPTTVIPQPEWRLPDPPPGQQWHRTDWTQDMLPEGYRPLLLGEVEQPDDEYKADEFPWDINPMSGGASHHDYHRRTRRPLPATVEYVPLGPEDVPPGSAVRISGYNDGWAAVVAVDEWGLYIIDSKESWTSLAEDHVILRPGSTTWEPCKKPKA